MKVDNIRYGFATNSSSSHSVVLAPGLTDSALNGMGYGWDNFVLASTEEKRRYLFASAYLHYSRNLSSREAAVLARDAFPVSDEDFAAAVGDPSDNGWNGDCYIDHQSKPNFPSPRNSEHGMQPLWDLFNREIVHNDNVAILGGNDNQDNERWKPAKAQYAPEIAVWNDLADSGGAVFNVDAGGHFAVFNKRTGKKLRFLPEGVAKPQIAAVPELIDIKITDYCPVGCSYCYQGSTKKGKHADIKHIHEFANYLGNMGVFEVAIGGGDPTTHPEFPAILRAFHRNGVVPNFSTQLWDWLDKPEIVDAVKECCGAVALSTQSPEHAKRWFDTTKEIGIKGHVHYVLGLKPLSNLKAMFEADSHGYIVLLAYKEIGRAKGHPPIDYTGWQDIVRKHNKQWWTVAVDSFLVDDVREGFTRDEVPGELFEQADGKFSFYWDAVEGSYAVHSFKPQSERLVYGEKSADKLAEAWMKLSGSPHQVSVWGRGC